MTLCAGLPLATRELRSLLRAAGADVAPTVRAESEGVRCARGGDTQAGVGYDELLDGMSGRFSFGPGDGYDEGSESEEEEEEGEEGDEWDGAEEESESDDDGGADGVTETQAPRAGPSASPS